MRLEKLTTVDLTRFHDGTLNAGMINRHVTLGSRIPLEGRNPVNIPHMSLTSESIAPEGFYYYKCSNIPLNIVQDIYQESLNGSE